MKQNNTTIDIFKIPDYVTKITNTLEKAGFEVFLVGGCVRDLILGNEPKDWDLTTNAKPDQIILLFEKTIYENDFGTVGVCIPKENVSINSDISYNIVEVTPYRIESKYNDNRHPDDIVFSDKLEDDLKRRDFTINALALGTDGSIKDIFGGLKDIKDKVLRTVGNPSDRFQEDALRMLRAVRFSSQLGFAVSYETLESITSNKELIKNVSFERIRDEFNKIIMSNNSVLGIGLLEKLGLLKYIIPELEEGIGCEQSGEHIYDVFNHLLHALDHATSKNWSLEIRLSALFHDIGKPRSRRISIKFKDNFLSPRTMEKKGPDYNKLSLNSKSKKKYTFYGHEVVGARMVKVIMERLKYPKDTSELVECFTRNHMFFSDTEKISLSAVRRVIQNVGKENIWELMKVRECDRVGMKKVEAPYRLRKYHAMIEEVLHDPISVSQLAIDGEYMINMLHMKPGPRMGWILNALLEEVLEDPSKNTKGHLSEIIKDIDSLKDNELKMLGHKGKNKKEELEHEQIKKLHAKHGV